MKSSTGFAAIAAVLLIAAAAFLLGEQRGRDESRADPGRGPAPEPADPSPAAAAEDLRAQKRAELLKQEQLARERAAFIAARVATAKDKGPPGAESIEERGLRHAAEREWDALQKRRADWAAIGETPPP